MHSPEPHRAPSTHIHTHTHTDKKNETKKIGGDSPTIDPSSLDEPSVPYSIFLERLNSDMVEYVEFIAPNGDAAYVTFKSANVGGAVDGGGIASSSGSSRRMRIGEGYPIEDPRGWSSPAFVVKAVAKRGVPYRFVVPGLGDSFR